MNAAKVAEFTARYETLDEWGLLDIDSRRPTLTDEARFALDQTLSKRGIDLVKLKELEAQDIAQQAKLEQERQIKFDERDARYTKIMWIVCLPIMVFAAVFQTESAFQTLISTLVQVALLGLVNWGYLKFKRSRGKRKP